METYRDILATELERRKGVNVRYSLRAFARDLGLAPSRVSEVLNGTRGVSERAAQQMAERLRFGKDLRDWFVLSVAAEHARSPTRRRHCRERLEALGSPAAIVRERVESSYNIVAWYYGAVLEACRLPGFEATAGWVARRLGVTDFQVRSAWRYLQRWQHLTPHGSTLEHGPSRKLGATGLPARLLRLHYEQILAKAAEAYQKGPPDELDFTAQALTFDDKGVAQARAAIRSLRKELFRLSEQSKGPRRVYFAATQLFDPTQG